VSADDVAPPGADVEDVHHDDVTDAVSDSYPEPRAHGASVSNMLNDLSPSDRRKPLQERDTLYQDAVDYWVQNVQDREHEPYLAVEDFSAGWLPDDGHDYALVVKSSGWKAGTGRGDDYTRLYEQHVMLRRWSVLEDDDGTEHRELEKGPLALHVEIMPQYADLVYESGDPLQFPDEHGEGTRLEAWSTWAQSGREIEHRMYDALRAVYGDDAVNVDRDRNPAARRIQKAEAHVRFVQEKKNAVVRALNRSERLIDYGGQSEIEEYKQRVQAGWQEARVESDRWHLLGFEPQRYSTEVKVYQAQDWHKRPKSDFYAHPKLEASFAGTNDGALPHVDAWDDVLDHLRTVVATHAHWAGVNAADLVADDYFDGPAAPSWDYERPTGRRQMLQSEYEDRATDVYREALKESTTSVYDILDIVVQEYGATYGELERQTGLARSTVRYHVRRLAEAGVLERIGNPTLVVYTSDALYEKAQDVLQRVNPDDTQDDREERAQARRERREREQDPAPTEDDHGDEDAGGSGSRSRWQYLEDWHGTPQMLIDELVRGDRTEEDVRVRRLGDEDDPPPT
jgi:DNA-binding transcriptional ArsR family regulator